MNTLEVKFNQIYQSTFDIKSNNFDLNYLNLLWIQTTGKPGFLRYKWFLQIPISTSLFLSSKCNGVVLEANLFLLSSLLNVKVYLGWIMGLNLKRLSEGLISGGLLYSVRWNTTASEAKAKLERLDFQRSSSLACNRPGITLLHGLES